MQVTKEFVFDCAHKLNDYEFLHGHTYKLHVTLKGKAEIMLQTKAVAGAENYMNIQTIISLSAPLTA